MGCSVHASPTHSYWHDLDNQLLKNSKNTISSESTPIHSRKLRLDSTLLKETLLMGGDLQSKSSVSTKPKITIDLPLPSGGFQRVSVSEYSVLSPELETRYPNIKTWRLQGIDDKRVSGQLDITPSGFHGMLMMPDGDIVYVDPENDGTENIYLSLSKNENQDQPKVAFSCNVLNANSSTRTSINNKNELSRKIALQPAPNLITYRLAIAGTAEYSRRNGGSALSAYAAVVTTINRVNALFRRDIGISLQLVSDESLMYLDAVTDPYTSGNIFSLLSENRTNMDALIGSENYDVGHVFDASSIGGAAFLASACEEGGKAGGASGLSNPMGDVFSLKYVAHEIAHQLGATHSFNSTVGACGGGNRTAGLAVEPGSGSSIMSYAGLCGSDNLQSGSNAVFHWKSIEQIYLYTRTLRGSNCGIRSASGTENPVANSGGNLQIPVKTPFLLSGTATGGSSYSWDQTDSGSVTALDVDSGNNALIRQKFPDQADRYIPRLSDLFGASHTRGEKLPQMSRDLNFAFVVRNGGGGVGVSFKKVSVTDTGTQFKVLSQSTTQNLVKGQSIDVVWEVAQTNEAPINCAVVDINLLQMNGEKNILIKDTENDGTEQVTIPSNSPLINDARIMVSCNVQSFFQLSTGKISVNEDIGDIEPPVINLLGDTLISLFKGSPYIETGATAQDNIDTSVEVVISGVVDTSIVGSYQIIYRATDDAGNSSTAVRKINVVDKILSSNEVKTIDTLAPEITLVGNSTINLRVGDVYIDPGVSGVDNIDGELKVTVSGEVDTGIVGTYIVTYAAIDKAGNKSAKERTIIVVKNEKQLVSGTNNQTLESNRNNELKATGGGSMNLYFLVFFLFLIYKRAEKSYQKAF